VILQRFVPAAGDVRVIAVDGELFAALIVSDAEHQVDYRPGLSAATITPHCLPDVVETAVRALMAELGLTYGAIDLRLTPAGDHVFLEVNPAGEYLFVSSRTGQPVPQAIAAALVRAR
jgi:glutathione synthase/RimK-type ligase-like ATP-grasp enzyme